MKNKLITLLIVTCFIQNKNIHADQVITFFLKPYSAASNAFAKKLQKPGAIARSTLRNFIKTNIAAGIFASYGGFLTLSAGTGQVTFPRKHTPPFVYLVITSRMTPIMMAGNTVHHWELEEGTPAQMYRVERKDEETTKRYYWDIQKVDLPKDNRIPLESILIVAKPKHIYVPTGTTPSNDNPQLVLPDIFVKKGINHVARALYMLNLRHFFGSISSEYKKEATRYTYHLKY